MVLYERVGMPFEKARTLLAAGEVHRRARRRGHAREAIAAALGIFEMLGGPLWAHRARAEADRLGPAATGPVLGDGLTVTEKRVCELVVAGMTNIEVGSALFMSVKTVEKHLSQVYRKLGIRSRAQLFSAIEH